MTPEAPPRDAHPATPGADAAPWPTGLSAAEVAERVAAGRTNRSGLAPSRRVHQIVRANVLTPFNGLLSALVVVVLLTGRWQNALFGFVVVANSAIGTFQELRAKRTLDRLAVLTAPKARVRRDGAAQDIATEDVVIDDHLELRTGDQVCADGVVVSADAFEVDESLLSGESEPVAKAPGDLVRAGAVVVAGSAGVRATAVGPDSYATALAREARRFELVRSELIQATNRLLRWISLLMVVVGPLVLWSQFRTHDSATWRDAVTGATAALVGMIPEGLVLLTSLAFLVAAVSLARRNTLIQELPAVEVLARVDTVCLDKTGTLTHGEIAFDELVLLPGSDGEEVHHALALAAHVPDANATARALAEHFDTASWERTGHVPFSSARKWSSVSAREHGTWVLGAPEFVLPAPLDGPACDARGRADEIATSGRRVLLLAAGETPGGAPEATLPPSLQPRALVVLAERIRDDARETLRFFADQGVAVKVISGDNPRTVGAVAAAAGVPGVSRPEDAVDAAGIPEDPARIADVLETHSVFGRATPQQKRAFVRALQQRGHVVAMTGDGVNDVLALKDADIGVAMGSGAPATRAVAQLVLLDGRFAHLPVVVAEGRRVIANIERAANLFVVKNVYSLVLALLVLATTTAFPLAPVQLTLVSTLSIGVPAAVLALGPNTRRYVPGFLHRVLKFSVPVGVAVGAAAFTAYAVVRGLDRSAGVTGGRTAATTTVLICALWVLVVLARPLTGWRMALVATMAVAAAGAMAIPPLAEHLFLVHLTPLRVVVGAISGVVGLALVEIIQRRHGRSLSPTTASR